MAKRRTYRDWEHDARNSYKSVTKLGNELRDHWDDWKHESPYDSWDECIKAELGITAQALRDRNHKARKKNVSIAPSDTDARARSQGADGKSYPSRPATAIELERRRQLTVQLWHDGWSREIVRDVLGISPGSVRQDLVAMGMENNQPRKNVRHTDARPEGDFRWRDEDLPEEEESTIEQPSFAACETPEAAEAIEDVRIQLALILGGRYHLSLKDRNRLITVLENALERTRRHGATPEHTEDPSPRSSVAG